MYDLPETIFADPVWHALQTKHRAFAQSAGSACRYPADVAPFAAVATPSRDAMRELHSLLRPGEKVWLFGADYPLIPELAFVGTLDCLQMVLTEEITVAEDADMNGLPLSCAQAAEMVALTDLVFPGFFRARTCEMGTYYGIRAEEGLIAMAGERLIVEDHHEISGVCTHPEYRGKGLAANLIRQLMRNHRRDGKVSWLHVGRANHRAIDLYLRLGFRIVRGVRLSQITSN